MRRIPTRYQHPFGVPPACVSLTGSNLRPCKRRAGALQGQAWLTVRIRYGLRALPRAVSGRGLALRRSVWSLRTILDRSRNGFTKLLFGRARQSVCLLRDGWRRVGRRSGCRVATHEARDHQGDGQKPNPGEPSVKRNQGDALFCDCRSAKYTREPETFRMLRLRGNARRRPESRNRKKRPRSVEPD
jgi:hypothetical protein